MAGIERAWAGTWARAWTFGGLLASPEYDERFIDPTAKTAVTMGMGMTEKQGGSDVRANTTRAVRDGDDAWGERWRLVGHKWFMSAPMSDAFLVVAQAPAGPTCFFLAGSAAAATTLAAALSTAGVCRSVTTATGPAPGATVAEMS